MRFLIISAIAALGLAATPAHAAITWGDIATYTSSGATDVEVSGERGGMRVFMHS